jgi:hypothetical protein
MGIHIQTNRLMKYAIDMGSGAMVYISSFIKTGSATQKFTGGGVLRHTDSMVIA